ncbi:MAG: InlB B-repeat-containing protein [Lachnospiraceae bacterium]|nr:InlB B-repeat-containing protein [Lachnospiraceae bacterium]
MKKSIKQVLSYIISAILIIGLFAFVMPQNVIKAKATGTNKAIQIGPDVLGVGANNIDGKAATIYYNSYKKYDDSNIDWVLNNSWYVIGYGGNGVASDDNTMVLLSKNSIFNINYSSGKSNAYADSNASEVAKAFYNERFSSIEKESIESRTLFGGSGNYGMENYDEDKISGNSLSGVKLWLLSSKEANLVDSEIRKCNEDWYLRSPGRLDFFAGGVSYDGSVYKEGFPVGWDPANVGFRPAFILNKSSVILVSAAQGGKESGNIGSSALMPISEYTNTEWKVTLHDTSRDSFAVSRIGNGNITLGDNISFSYENANEGEKEFVSAILFDSNDNAVSYGRIVNVTDTSLCNGTASVKIPSDLIEGETYTLKFLSEQYNGDKLTDLASKFDDSRNIVFKIKKNPQVRDFVVSTTDKIYDGNASAVSVSVATDVSGIGTPVVEYYDDKGNKLDSTPIQPGLYKVKLIIPEGIDYNAANLEDPLWNFTIFTRDYNVILNTNGGKINSNDVKSYTYQKGAILPTANDISKRGYVFDGWFDNEELTGSAITSITVSENGNKEYFAKWNPNSYSVKFDANGGSGTMADMSRKYGDNTALTANAFTYDGHIFSGWNTQADGNGTSFANESADNLICEDNVTVTLYAQWDSVFYNVATTDDGNGTEIASATSGIKGTNITLTATPNEGYKFAGWEIVSGEAKIKDESEASTILSIGTSDVEVKANFEEIPDEPEPTEPEEPQEPTEPEVPEEPEEPEIPEKDWLDDLWLALRIADELGGAQTVEYSGDFALSYDIMTYLVEHPSITFIYHVTYEDVEYTIIIPAGKAVSSPEIPWYGPLWLLANYGNGKVPQAQKGTNE